MKRLLLFFAGAWLLAGCVSPNVNPPAARADTGYVDFYTIAGGDLNWEVARFDERSQGYRVVFSELKPLPSGVLRLAFSPGNHRLRVTFLNRIIREPKEFEVGVVAQMITPVHVVLTEAGVTQVAGQERRPAGKGYQEDYTAMHRVSTVVNPPMPYRLKEQMPYAY